MGRLRSNLLTWAVLCISNLVLVPMAATQTCSSHEKHIALFTFGDSLFDVGNNNYLKNNAGTANKFPYGQHFFKFASGRFSNGRNIADFIAQYLNLPIISPYLLPAFQQYMNGANFASGGAGALVETNPGLVLDLPRQLRYFLRVEAILNKRIGNPATKSLISKALFTFSIGGNDYIAKTINSTTLQSFTNQEYVSMVIGNVTMIIKEIYKLGGRRFGFLNVLPVGCTPMVKAEMNITSGCAEEANVLAIMHNVALPKALKNLQAQLEGFEYSVFDLYTTLGDRMLNPHKYGFKEGDNMACCGSGPYRGLTTCGKEGIKGIQLYEVCEFPDLYVHFDPIHPTDRACRQLAELAWNGSSIVSSPQNFKSLLRL